MNIQPLNPFYIIEKLTEEVAQLKKENEDLKKQILKEESNVTLADSDS